jgi:uncharacterized damage-inducible protein DinB
MSEATRIREEIRLACGEEPWHGPGLTALLQGVDATMAAARPIPGAHTIWELVLHLTGWTREVTRRLEGGSPGEPPEGDWPAVPEATSVNWARAKGALADAHQQLITKVERFPEARLFHVIEDHRTPPSSATVTYYQMLHGLVQHDAYHGGQIAMLKKALASR